MYVKYEEHHLPRWKVISIKSCNLSQKWREETKGKGAYEVNYIMAMHGNLQKFDRVERSFHNVPIPVAKLFYFVGSYTFCQPIIPCNIWNFYELRNACHRTYCCVIHKLCLATYHIKCKTCWKNCASSEKKKKQERASARKIKNKIFSVANILLRKLKSTSIRLFDNALADFSFILNKNPVLFRLNWLFFDL